MEDMNLLSIGMKIQEHRVKKGFSQEILAEKLGVSKTIRLKMGNRAGSS